MPRVQQFAFRVLAQRLGIAPQALICNGWQRLVATSETQLQARSVVSRDLFAIPQCTCGFSSSAAVFKQPPPPSEVPLDHEHVNIGNENDKEIIRATDKGTSDALFEVVKLHGSEFTETNVATVFDQLAKVASAAGEDKEKIHDHPTFQDLVDMVVLGRRRYNVKHLAQILHSLAILKFDNDMVFDRMSQHIMDKLPKADCRTLVDLATGLAEMEHSPSVVLFEAVQKRALEMKSDFSKEEKTALDKAYEKLGYPQYKLSAA